MRKAEIKKAIRDAEAKIKETEELLKNPTILIKRKEFLKSSINFYKKLLAKVETAEETKKKKSKLYKLCDKTNTSKIGIDYLLNYYIDTLGWTEEKAIEYAIGLFKNGTIDQLKIIGKDGEPI